MVIAATALIVLAAILSGHLSYAFLFGFIGAGLFAIEWATRDLDD